MQISGGGDVDKNQGVVLLPPFSFSHHHSPASFLPPAHINLNMAHTQAYGPKHWFMVHIMHIRADMGHSTIATGVNEYQPQKSTLDIIKTYEVAQNYSLLSMRVND